MSPVKDPLRFFLGAGALSGLVSIGFHSFFDFNLEMPANAVYFVLLMAIVCACTQGAKRREQGAGREGQSEGRPRLQSFLFFQFLLFHESSFALLLKIRITDNVFLSRKKKQVKGEETGEDFREMPFMFERIGKRMAQRAERVALRAERRVRE